MKKTVIAAICIVLVFVANGCLKTRDKAINQIEEDELRPVSSILLSEEDAKKLNEKLQVLSFKPIIRVFKLALIVYSAAEIPAGPFPIIITSFI
jgi:hypothetical protein